MNRLRGWSLKVLILLGHGALVVAIWYAPQGVDGLFALVAQVGLSLLVVLHYDLTLKAGDRG